MIDLQNMSIYLKIREYIKNTLPVEEVVARFIKEELSEMEGAENITPEQIKDIITKEGSE